MPDRFRQHGAFSWCELLTTDPASAAKFYAKLFGWKTEDMSLKGMDYIVVNAGGEDIGGIMKIPPQAQGAPPHWGPYVTVDDVDATARRAGELGGKVLVPPQDIPGVGRFCVVQDPQGAVISAITYERQGG